MAKYTGSPVSLGRRSDKEESTVTAGTTEGGSDSIDMQDFAGALVKRASGAATDCKVYAAEESADTFKVVKDSAGVDVPITIGDNWVPLPSEAFAARFIKIVSDSGTAEINVMRKG